MNKVQKIRLGKALQKVADYARDLTCSLNNALTMAAEVAEHENALAAVANYDLVHALRPIARDLSTLTGKRYVEILDQAQAMILEGKDIPDVLWHFDLMLRELNNG